MNQRPSAHSLRLADHMRACKVDDQMILLDLHASRYIGLAGPQAAAVSSIVGLDTVASGIEPTPKTLRVVDALCRKGILTRDPHPAQAVHTRVLSPTVAIDVRDDVPYRPLGVLATGGFFAATLLTSLLLRLCSLEHISERLQRSRARLLASNAPQHAERLHAEVATFDTLRPLAFTSRNECLFDSLALVLFLARRGIAAHCVLGVATKPFRAHAWAQHGDLVLNDLPEHVRGFSVIQVL